MIKTIKCESTDPRAEIVLSQSEPGTTILFTDRTVLVKETEPTFICKRCIFNDKSSTSTKCPRRHLCFANYRKDRKSVSFVDLEAYSLIKTTRNTRDKEAYRRKKKGM